MANARQHFAAIALGQVEIKQEKTRRGNFGLTVQIVDEGNRALAILDHLKREYKMVRLNRFPHQEYVGLVVLNQDDTGRRGADLAITPGR